MGWLHVGALLGSEAEAVRLWARGRGPAGPGIVPGSGSDPSVIFEAGIRIPAVFGAVGIKLVVSRRIRAELRSAGPNMQHPGYYT